MTATATPGQVATGHVRFGNFGPAPLVNWTELVAADTPTEEPTRYRLKALRQRNETTPGVRVTLRGGQRASGTASYYSALSVWSTRLRRAGRTADAEQLLDDGAAIEKTYDRYLRAYLSHHELADLPRADFYPRLVADTAAALAGIKDMTDDDMVFVGQVKDRMGRSWRIEGRSEDGTEQQVNVLDKLLTRHGLGQGSFVLVIERMVGNVAVTEVEPAVAVSTDVQTLEGPPYSDEEYSQLAARYRTSGGRAPTAAERARDNAAVAAGTLPQRKITLDG